MKRLFVIFLSILIGIAFVGYDPKGTSLSAGQQKAVENSMEYIGHPPFNSMGRIDTDIIKIENATENTWKSMWYEGSQIKKNGVDLNAWVITIGDTSNHAFAFIFCDSSTYKVIGSIPMIKSMSPIS